MAKMRTPELKVVRFSSEDVIATSIGIMSVADYQRSWMYTVNPIDTAGYVEISGAMTYYDDVAQGWFFSADPSNASSMSSKEYHNLVSSAGHKSHYLYDLYVASNDSQGSNTQVYTKGASYYELYGNSQ